MGICFHASLLPHMFKHATLYEVNDKGANGTHVSEEKSN